MPFITACPFCPNKLKVPDQSLGASLRCPKCGNYFTVAPSELAARNPVRPPSAGGHAAAPASPPAAASPLAAFPVPAPTTPAAPASFFPEPPVSSSSSLPAWINGWGAIAFFLASLGLLFAAFTFPRLVTISLAALAFLVSLAGVLPSIPEWKTKDGVWLLLGGGASALLLLLSLLRPGWLNSRWGMDFAVPEPDKNKQVLVSRDGKTIVRDLSGGEWVDADTNAIRQGDLFIRVESVVVDRVLEKDQPGLLITLQITNESQLHQVLYRGQASGESSAIVRDSRGKELQQRNPGPGAKKSLPIKTASILPFHDLKDFLLFEPPWSGTGHLELELPAAAWGREGVCKFKIPQTFVVHKVRNQ